MFIRSDVAIDESEKQILDRLAGKRVVAYYWSKQDAFCVLQTEMNDAIQFAGNYGEIIVEQVNSEQIKLWEKIEPPIFIHHWSVLADVPDLWLFLYSQEDEKIPPSISIAILNLENFDLHMPDTEPL